MSHDRLAHPVWPHADLTRRLKAVPHVQLCGGPVVLDDMQQQRESPMLRPLDDTSDQRITHSVPAQVRPDSHRHQLGATAGGIHNGGSQAAACTRLVKPQQGHAGAEPAPPVIDTARVLTLQRRAESSRRVRQGSYAQVAEKRLVTRLTETQPHAAEASVGCPQLAAVPPGTALPGGR